MDPLVAKALGFTFSGIDFEATGIMILGGYGGRRRLFNKIIVNFVLLSHTLY
jgi:hypothetical protein